MPLPSELFDRTRGAQFFSTIDLKNGFYQIRMAEGDCWKTAFATPDGLFEFCVLPMGLCNAPATFMRLMHETFRDMIDAGHVIVYLDDILIYSKTLEEHERHVQAVFERLRREQLYAKASKCKLFRTEVKFLGHRLAAGSLGTLEDKTSAVAAWPTPTKIEHVRSFCGLVNYYRSFIPHCSEMMQPLMQLTHKNAAWRWDAEQDNAFVNLKHALSSSPVLRLPDADRPFVVATDASDGAIGAVLMQAASDGAPLQPVGFFSRALHSAERNYSVREKEALAIVAALQHWRHHLAGRKQFTVQTDHESLKHLETQRSRSPRVARWTELLADYTFVIQAVRGTANAAADALSRRPDFLIPAGDAPEAAELLAAARSRRAAPARPPAQQVAVDRAASRAAAELTLPPTPGRPAPNAAGVRVMPSQRCTAEKKGGGQCGCRTKRGNLCHNHLRSAEGLAIKLAQQRNAGMGLYATRQFRAGERIAMYTGDRIVSDNTVGERPMASTYRLAVCSLCARSDRRRSRLCIGGA